VSPQEPATAFLLYSLSSSPLPPCPTQGHYEEKFDPTPGGARGTGEELTTTWGKVVPSMHLVAESPLLCCHLAGSLGQVSSPSESVSSPVKLGSMVCVTLFHI
jgi:hypothetical protein